MITERPVFAGLPVAVLFGMLFLVDGRARVGLVVFGGLLLFQRSSGLNSLKLGLLFAFLAAFIGALFHVRTLRQTKPYQVVAPLFLASILLAAIVGLSLVHAHLNGTPLPDSIRDATPYLLFASVPIFALDAQAVLPKQVLIRVLVVAGVLGAVSFAVVWLQRRQIASLPLSRLGAESLYVPAALFAYAMSVALELKAKRWRWVWLAAILAALLVTTGTRTTLALFVAPFAIVIATRRRMATRSFRLALIGPSAILLVLALSVGVVVATNANTSYFQKRVSLVAASGNRQADASYNDRINEGRAAWSAFRTEPLFGVGTGHAFQYLPQGARTPVVGFQLDTPVTYLAKFGIVGLLLVAFVTVRFWSVLSRIRRLAPGIPYLAVAGYLAIVVALSIFAPPFEDKGFSYGLIILLALALSSVRDVVKTEGVVASSPR